MFFEFDGVMSHCEVFVNGVRLGEHVYGYTSFCFEATEIIHAGENLLAVHTRHHGGASRWYTGGGIFRHVRAVITGQTRIARNGVFVSADGDAETATVRVRVATENVPAGACVKLAVAKPGMTVPVTAETFACGVPVCLLSVAHPLLWDVHTKKTSPPLYTLTVTLQDGGNVLDEVTVRFGIRYLGFDRDKGFFLNGAPLKWQGVCLHHDAGCVGSAVHRASIRRQLELLRHIGVNAIRTSHNPPAPELLDTADELGMLVIVEAFDEWRHNKTQHGYGDHFSACAEADLTEMVRAHRNHPSVILWSMGNEIAEQSDADGADVARRLSEIAKREDPTRLTTAGFDNYDMATANRTPDGVDIAGFNYKPHCYKELHERYPWMQYGSETASCVSSRGEYIPEVGYTRVPQGGSRLAGSPSNLADGWVPAYCEVPVPCRENHHVNSYDLSAPLWAYPPDVEFRAQDECPYSFGEFVWTGFDYLGEPTPYRDWPSRSSYFGIFDLAGLPKDRAYLYESKWTNHTVLHLVPDCWNFPEGTHLPVHCYTSFRRAELFVNGVSQGVREKDPTAAEPMKRYRLMWDNVAYKPGTLRVVAYNDNGGIAETAFIRTAGEAARLDISAYAPRVTADGEDLAYLTVRVADRYGTTVPDACRNITVRVENGELVGTDNGDQTDMTVFPSHERRAFHGYMIAVVRANPGLAGVLRVSVTSPGLKQADIGIPIVAPV